MSNKTLIPALRARVGDWTYYVCIMKYAQVAKEFQFAFELGGNTDLNALIQRGLSQRTKEIANYLLSSSHRFLGSLIVAAWGGKPNYVPVRMEDTEEMLEGLDQSFGVLTFDGSQQYFALDGQHRLKAIKDVVKKRPELGAEEISVILVSHYDTVEGQQRTRRLFSNINKNAKTTTPSENIALDEDDGFAILNRRLIQEDPFFSGEGRVKVFGKIGGEGELSIAGDVAKSDKVAFLSIKQLYEMMKDLGFALDPSMSNKSLRPSDDVLDTSFTILQERIHKTMEACGDIESLVDSHSDMKLLRAPPQRESDGHPFMRGVVQRAVTQVIRRLMDQKALSFEEILTRLSQLEWRLAEAPWIAVTRIDAETQKVRMLTQRDHKDLLEQLLLVHTAPPSRQHVKRVRRDYAELMKEKYPVSEDELAKLIVGQDETINR